MPARTACRGCVGPNFVMSGAPRWQIGLLLASAILAARTIAAGAEVPSHERAALMDLYHATNGPSWSSHLGWGSDMPVCEWTGIMCGGGNDYVMRM